MRGLSTAARTTTAKATSGDLVTITCMRHTDFVDYTVRRGQGGECPECADRQARQQAAKP